MADSQTAAPYTDFSAVMTGAKPFQLSGRPARYTVLYFYPKDNTPGCTTESIAFRELYPAVSGKPIPRSYGISRDSMRSHDGFKAKLELPFQLISDPDEDRLPAI